MKWIVLFIFCLLLSRDAHAYLDPGTGSMIVQMIIGGVLAASYAIKMYWKKIKAFFSRKKELP